MSSLRLSVVLPNYNHSEFLPKALDGIFFQGRPADEVIVVDDGSTDDSVEIIRSYAEKYPQLRLIENRENKGVMYSVNLALREATGDFIAFQSADDMLLPGFFAETMAILEKYPQAGLCCTNPAWMGEGIEAFRFDDYGWSQESCYISPDELVPKLQDGDMLKTSFLAGHASVFRRDAVIEAGGQIPELRWNCDWFAAWVLAFRHGVCYVPMPLAALRIRAESYTSGMTKWDTQSEVLAYMLRLLLSPKYSDVLPYFQKSRVMEHFHWLLAQLIISRREFWNTDCLAMIERYKLPDYWK